MPIRLRDLEQASARTVYPEVATLTEALQKNVRTAFLSHSHLDAKYATGFVTMLREAGWNVYIDWLDASLPSKPNRDTAAKIKTRIDATEYFLFLATPNSMASRWCPWEIGYADGVKDIEKILVVSTEEDSGEAYGSQYLGLYRRVDFSTTNRLAVWQPGESTGGIFVERL